MSKRITITIDDDISDKDALEYVLYAITHGRISHDSKGRPFYCWHIIFPDKHIPIEDIALYTSRKSKEPNSSFKITRVRNESL